MVAVGNEDEKLTKDILKQSVNINSESDRKEILEIARKACVVALEKSNLSLTKIVFAKKLVFVDDKLYPKYNQTLIDAAITSDFVGGLRFLEAQGLVFEFPTWNALRESVEKGKILIVGYLLDIPWIKLHLKFPFDKTLIAIAASKCDMKMLNILLNSKAKDFINYTCSTKGYAALHHCLEAGPKNADSFECVQSLVENGADVNLAETKDKRRTPLLMAVKYNLLDIVLFLIDAGADVMVLDSIKNTALHYLAERWTNFDASRIKTCIERLVNGGLNVNTVNRSRETALFMAIGNWKHDVARVLIKHGAELNLKQGENSWTALKQVFLMRDPIGIKILMDAGCEIGDMKKDGLAYLMKAVKNGWADVVQGLIERGVDVHARDEKGYTALYYCHDEMGRNLGQILPLLESVGFNILEDDSGEAFLNLAISRLDLDAIDFLVKRKVNVSQISTCGESMLHRLAWKKSERDDLQRLFEYGIDVDQKETKEGSTALRNAATRGNVRFVKFLINNGCDINIADNYGITAVIKTAIAMKKITLKLLLKSGANANLLNNSGQPAVNYLDMSKPDDYKDCLRWILHFRGGKSVQFPDRTGLTLLERLVHRPFIEPIWYLITANCNFQPLVNRVPPKKLDETFLPIAKALYESGTASREIAKLLGEKTKQQFHEYVTSKFSLKSVCRRSIRIHLGLGITEKVQRLHIPSTVKDYLLMKSIIPVEYSNLADGVELDEDEEPKYFFTPSAEFLKYM
ncbi:hypothetical protein SNE40_002259 [Patella caerulea]|uniref:SOCS box domain-containing protein n=2 Tax=Patella caerulea TaxID=87958 RepID=A0AAN8K7E4_PATCE